jgi:hypothetical protein
LQILRKLMSFLELKESQLLKKKANGIVWSNIKNHQEKSEKNGFPDIDHHNKCFWWSFKMLHCFMRNKNELNFWIMIFCISNLNAVRVDSIQLIKSMKGFSFDKKHHSKTITM